MLWEELIRDWELNEEEVAYINRQQGLSCAGCGNNLRSMVLAKAILNHMGSSDFLSAAPRRFKYRKISILEINEAGGLNPYLTLFRKHKIIRYPDADMMHLNEKNESWDLVVHSETLEHVPDPRRGLNENWRILKKGGACIFTVPLIMGRMSRSRDGMKHSYHGDPAKACEDHRVFTEFGADVWSFVMEAGFETCTIHALDYPAGIAIEAIK